MIIGIKIQPIIKNEIKEALEETSDPNVTIRIKSGIVNIGCPIIETRTAIFFIIINIKKYNFTGLGAYTMLE